MSRFFGVSADGRGDGFEITTAGHLSGGGADTAGGGNADGHQNSHGTEEAQQFDQGKTPDTPPGKRRFVRSIALNGGTHSCKSQIMAGIITFPVRKAPWMRTCIGIMNRIRSSGATQYSAGIPTCRSVEKLCSLETGCSAADRNVGAPLHGFRNVLRAILFVDVQCPNHSSWSNPIAPHQAIPPLECAIAKRGCLRFSPRTGQPGFRRIAVPLSGHDGGLKAHPHD
jgi:hypothetical protein